MNFEFSRVFENPNFITRFGNYEEGKELLVVGQYGTQLMKGIMRPVRTLISTESLYLGMAKVNHRRAYLTKRALLRATGKATHSVSLQAMALKGYVIQAENGWIVKIDNSGQKENISRIAATRKHGQVVLD